MQFISFVRTWHNAPLIALFLSDIRFQDAENDCTEALNLDDRYIKAYSRRSTARKELRKLKESVDGRIFIFWNWKNFIPHISLTELFVVMQMLNLLWDWNHKTKRLRSSMLNANRCSKRYTFYFVCCTTWWCLAVVYMSMLSWFDKVLISLSLIVLMHQLK